MSIWHRTRVVPALVLSGLLGGATWPGAVTTTETRLPAPQTVECEPDNAGLTLPVGFCAVLFARDVTGARHIQVAPNGDVFVARRNLRTRDRGAITGGVTVLRDTDGDGKADLREEWSENGGTGILLHDDHVYFAPDDAVLRYALVSGSMTPAGRPDTIVMGLPSDRNHAAKSIAIGPDGSLYINIGAPSNACQVQSRQQGSPGVDPCPQLEDRGGIWQFSASRARQRQDGKGPFATGLRNVVALALNPATGSLFGVMHGRDSLHELWPELFTEAQRVEKPAEEFVLIERGDDFGWPYCYHDPETATKYLGPEYGGDGRAIGRCASAKNPLIGFPAHWAPNGLVFYEGGQFPERYRGGAFIAFHGSWNRAPAPQAGYNVVFVPMSGDRVTGDWSVFADGFAGADVSPRGAAGRPSGIAVGPDGSLYISDDRGGSIWRILYRGE
ncbi:MAG: sorbosone dehydrogenase family protein [Gemmatimonadota bacterium]|nr:MAG: sorbosone dehydrogenase family protein [Gemmatimonadota bacterium]